MLGGLPLSRLWAETTALRVSQPNGESMLYVLADRPTLTQEEDKMCLTDGKSTITLDDVATFTFVDDASIEGIGLPTLFFMGHTVLGKGLKPQQRCLLYSIDGKLLANTTADALGNVEIALPVDTETFIFRTGTANIKFTTK